MISSSLRVTSYHLLQRTNPVRAGTPLGCMCTNSHPTGHVFMVLSENLQCTHDSYYSQKNPKKLVHSDLDGFMFSPTISQWNDLFLALVTSRHV
jgi:hypothetical protein